MIVYQTIWMRVGNVGEQNMKVSPVGGEGEVGSSIHPMWRRWKGEECLPPQSTPASSSPFGGVSLPWGEENNQNKKRVARREPPHFKNKREMCIRETKLSYTTKAKLNYVTLLIKGK